MTLSAGARRQIAAPAKAQPEAGPWLAVLLVVLALASEVGPEAIALRAVASADALDALTFLEAAINADVDRLDVIAQSLNVDADALAAVAALAAMPLLQAMRRRFGAAVDPRWSEGFCPLCGGWPHLAEQRGVERARRRLDATWRPLPLLRRHRPRNPRRPRLRTRWRSAQSRNLLVVPRLPQKRLDPARLGRRRGFPCRPGHH